MKLCSNILLIFVSFLVIFQFAFANIKLLRSPAQDFEVNYLAGKQLISNHNPYLKLRKDIVRITPPTLVIFEFFALFPILVSQIIFFFVSLASFFLGSFFLFKILGMERNWKLWFSYISLVLIFFPFRYNLGSGQVNNFLFLFLVLAYYFFTKKKYFQIGLFLALAIILKLTPILFLLPFLANLELKGIKWILINIVLIILLTLPFIGITAYQNYLSVPGTFFDFKLSAYVNQALTGFLARVSQNDFLNQLIYLILAFVSLVTLGKQKLQIPVWNIVIMYMLIFSPFSWQYHFTIAIFPLLSTAFLIKRLQLPLRFYLFLLASYLLLGLNIKKTADFFSFNLLGTIVLSHVLIGAVLLVFINFILARKMLKENN